MTPSNILLEGQDIGFSCSIDRDHGNGIRVGHFSYDFAGCTFIYKLIPGSDSEYQLDSHCKVKSLNS